MLRSQTNLYSSVPHRPSIVQPDRNYEIPRGPAGMPGCETRALPMSASSALEPYVDLERQVFLKCAILRILENVGIVRKTKNLFRWLLNCRSRRKKHRAAWWNSSELDSCPSKGLTHTVGTRNSQNAKNSLPFAVSRSQFQRVPRYFCHRFRDEFGRIWRSSMISGRVRRSGARSPCRVAGPADTRKLDTENR